MAKTRFPSSVKAMDEGQVMQIMALHSTYRKQKEALQGQPIAEPNPNDAFEIAMHEWKTRPMMTDREFLDELQKLVALDFPLVTTSIAAKIYNLRKRWEEKPPLQDGTDFEYKDTSIRSQVKTARKTLESGKPPTEHLLFPLTPEEEMEIWHQIAPRTNWFRLSDILMHKLGRWPNERKVERQPKKPHGRPSRLSKEEAAKQRAEVEARKQARIAAREAKQQALITAREEALQRKVEELQAELKRERVPEGV